LERNVRLALHTTVRVDLLHGWESERHLRVRVPGPLRLRATRSHPRFALVLVSQRNCAMTVPTSRYSRTRAIRPLASTWYTKQIPTLYLMPARLPQKTTIGLDNVCCIVQPPKIESTFVIGPRRQSVIWIGLL
jgi:hypothetical protein